MSVLSIAQASRRARPMASSSAYSLARFRRSVLRTSTGASAVMIPPRAINEGLLHHVVNLLEVLAGKDLHALLKMKCPEPCERVLDPRTVVVWSTHELADPDVEERQEQQKLLRREGAIAAFDLAQAVLRQLDLLRELGLRPSAQLA